MAQFIESHPDRLFPAEPNARSVTRILYNEIKDLPIISPHGHTDPSWFAENKNFTDPHMLLIAPDHYVLRMLYSQGIRLAQLGIQTKHESKQKESVNDPRSAWRLFAKNYYLFRGTPSGFWLNQIFSNVFKQSEQLSETSADTYFDSISEQLQKERTAITKQWAIRENMIDEVISNANIFHGHLVSVSDNGMPSIEGLASINELDQLN